MRIGIIGNGNLGNAFYKVLTSLNFNVALFARSPEATYEKNIKEIVNHQLDLIILAVNDNALQIVVESLIHISPNTILVHCSGATPIEIIENEVHKNIGVIYPLQTIIKGKTIEWKKVPIFVQGSNENTQEKLIGLAMQISDKVHIGTNENRLIVHLAAVLTNNFINHLAVLSFDLLDKYQIDKEVLKPILSATMEKILQNPPDLTQTGPAVRGDKITMQRHQNIISDRHLSKLYELFSDSIIQHHEKK